METIDANKTDLTVAISKGILGMVPCVGSLIAEVVGQVIPNQRVDRISRFIEKLETKVTGIEKGLLRLAITKPEVVDLLEDSFIQAARAMSGERLEYLAALLKNSLTTDEIAYAETKRIFALLGELLDPEVIILRSYLFQTMQQKEPEKEFFERNNAILEEKYLTHAAPEKEWDEVAISNSYRQHLTSLGLLKPCFWEASSKNPRFDRQTGMLEARGYEVTRLGGLLLRKIDRGAEGTNQSSN